MLEWLHMPWKKDDLEDLDYLESSLENAFRPVEPSPEFVRDLRRHLINFPAPIPDAPVSKVPLYIGLTIASLLSGVAIIGFGVWIILILVGKYQSHPKQVSSSPHAIL